jgi:hypothetical protein
MTPIRIVSNREKLPVASQKLPVLDYFCIFRNGVRFQRTPKSRENGRVAEVRVGNPLLRDRESAVRKPETRD